MTITVSIKCDNCGKQETLESSLVPDGWFRLVVTVEDSRGYTSSRFVHGPKQPMSAHHRAFCEECAVSKGMVTPIELSERAVKPMTIDDLFNEIVDNIVSDKLER